MSTDTDRLGESPDDNHDLAHSVIRSRELGNTEVNTDGLGDMQRSVLRALGILHQEHGGGQAGFVDYGRVTNTTFEVHFQSSGNVPTSAESHRASISRAISSLIERGLVAGAFRNWTVYRGRTKATTEIPWGYGPTPWDLSHINREAFEEERYEDAMERRPRIQYLKLTEDAWGVVESLLTEDVNDKEDSE
jgi:hypothetical protein